ncbi:hypothetical protein H920_01508 [Fukomys damarensis]|uniref:Uncharacterized protein n=1 Tax=Fukomys damarensis TaxID=885580 RepID=A0A091EN83_FUKDA|nr:hypothetical protein H920_01508 [Fukomys damarensis]
MAKIPFWFQIYYNVNFQRDKPGLLEHIWRKGDLRNPAMRGTCTPILLRNPAWQGIDEPNPKKKKWVATRHSPRFPRADSRESQGEAPQDEGPRRPPPIVFSGIWALKSIAGNTLDNQVPQVPRGPSKEGATGNGTAVPSATATEQGACEEPSSSSAYRDHCALMSLYNACYSIVLSAQTAKSPDELPDEEEEEEDFKSVLCEHLTDNPQP